MDLVTKYVFDIFKDFQRTLITCNLNNVHLKWKTTSLDLNTRGGEYLAFDSSSYTFWVTCVNAIGEKVQVIWYIFTNLVEDAKSSCLVLNLLPIFLVSLCFCVVYGSMFIYLSFLQFYYYFPFCLFLIFWACDIPCKYTWISHLRIDSKVSNISCDGCYGHFLFTILTLRQC